MTFFSKILFHPPDNLIQTDSGIPLPTVVGWGPSNCGNCRNATLHHFLFLGRREIGTKKRNYTARELNSQPRLRPRGKTLTLAFLIFCLDHGLPGRNDQNTPTTITPTTIRNPACWKEEKRAKMTVCKGSLVIRI